LFKQDRYSIGFLTVGSHLILNCKIYEIYVTVTSSNMGHNSLLWQPLYLGSKLWGLAGEFIIREYLYSPIELRKWITWSKIKFQRFYFETLKVWKYQKECIRILVGASLNNFCGLGLLCVSHARAGLELG